jgi:ribosomal protein L24E
MADGGSQSQGKLYVRGDSKIFRFQNGKSESLFLQRKNPRRIAWTVLYRRQHRKGISEVRALRLPCIRLGSMGIESGFWVREGRE